VHRVQLPIESLNREVVAVDGRPPIVGLVPAEVDGLALLDGAGEGRCLGLLGELDLELLGRGTVAGAGDVESKFVVDGGVVGRDLDRVFTGGLGDGDGDELTALDAGVPEQVHFL